MLSYDTSGIFSIALLGTDDEYIRLDSLQGRTLQRIRTVSIVVALGVALLVGASLAGAVPDARLTIDELEASPSEPLVGERVVVNVTATNSPGSQAPVNVTEVRLLDGDEVVDRAERPGALSASDSLDAQLWTSFDDPGEHRLTVEVVGELPPEEDEDDERETVRIQRDLFVDVVPAEANLELRTRALAADELELDDTDEPELGGDVGAIFGDGTTVLEDGEDEEPLQMDSPLAVTVVNTGTLSAERVVVEAAVDGEPVGPFAAPDVAAGTEERLLVDLGRVDSPANVTVETRYVTGDGSDGSVETELAYPPRDGHLVVTGADLTHREGGVVDVSANLGNVGERDVDGVTVRVGDAEGVQPSDDGSGYFVGVLAESEFMPAEVTATVDEGNATTIPLVVEYNDRGVRYTETLPVAYEPPPNEDGDADATFGTTAPIAVGLSLGVVGVVAIGLLASRRRRA